MQGWWAMLADPCAKGAGDLGFLSALSPRQPPSTRACPSAHNLPDRSLWGSSQGGSLFLGTWPRRSVCKILSLWEKQGIS